MSTETSPAVSTPATSTIDVRSSAPAWQDFRQRMPVARKCAYFDHAAVSPLPQPTFDAVSEWATNMAEYGDAQWLQWFKRLEMARSLAAKLINAEEDEIALARNTTEGINYVAEGFPWKAGDNIVIPAEEFPSNKYPWQHLSHRGVETRLVPCQTGKVQLDDIAAACDSRTRMIAASWVDYSTGWRNDAAALCELAHSRGAYFFLDAIQGLGVFPLDVQEIPIDFLSADGHKWMLGPEGAGMFYTRREHLDLLHPIGVGWSSAVNPSDYTQQDWQLKPSAGRYEGGTYPVGCFVGFAASLAFLAEFPQTEIAARVLHISQHATEELRAAGADIVSCRDVPASENEFDRRSGIVGFTWPGEDPVLVRKRCLEQDVVLSCRAGRLRVSLHAYNTEDDVARLIAALRG